MTDKYYGITHDKCYCSTEQLSDWRRTNCIKNIHLFDEVVSGDNHYLNCDACGLVINILNIDESFLIVDVRKCIRHKN